MFATRFSCFTGNGNHVSMYDLCLSVSPKLKMSDEKVSNTCTTKLPSTPGCGSYEEMDYEVKKEENKGGDREKKGKKTETE
ncbi:hypothetical protein M8J75_007965 [Diaphorina citri]|nr:hypothetical protein M8J75_007965 [Diaphorina citri]